MHVHPGRGPKPFINRWGQIHSTTKGFGLAVRKLPCSRASTIDRAFANFDQGGRDFAGPFQANAGATFIIRLKIPVNGFVENVV